jgi:hypothetical protein
MVDENYLDAILTGCCAKCFTKIMALNLQKNLIKCTIISIIQVRKIKLWSRSQFRRWVQIPT